MFEVDMLPKVGGGGNVELILQRIDRWSRRGEHSLIRDVRPDRVWFQAFLFLTGYLFQPSVFLLSGIYSIHIVLVLKKTSSASWNIGPLILPFSHRTSLANQSVSISWTRDPATDKPSSFIHRCVVPWIQTVFFFLIYANSLVVFFSVNFCWLRH